MDLAGFANGFGDVIGRSPSVEMDGYRVLSGRYVDDGRWRWK